VFLQMSIQAYKHIQPVRITQTCRKYN